VFFEQFVDEQINAAPQYLLMPKIITIPTADDEIITKAMDLFSQYGIIIEKFGKSLCRIDAIPQWLDEMLVEKLLLDVISGVSDEKNACRSMDRKWFARLACDHIDTKIYDEMETITKLVKLLLSSSNYSIDPYGNITLIEISLSELKNKFGLHKTIIGL
jgi:DNA mismatch repair ATPase MutL